MKNKYIKPDLLKIRFCDDVILASGGNALTVDDSILYENGWEN